MWVKRLLGLYSWVSGTISKKHQICSMGSVTAGFGEVPNISTRASDHRQFPFYSGVFTGQTAALHREVYMIHSPSFGAKLFTRMTHNAV